MSDSVKVGCSYAFLAGANAVARGLFLPVKYFFIGAIPEFIRRRDLSLLGTREKLGSLKCPLLSKKERNFSLKSLSEVHCIVKILHIKITS